MLPVLAHLLGLWPYPLFVVALVPIPMILVLLLWVGRGPCSLLVPSEPAVTSRGLPSQLCRGLPRMPSVV